VASLGIVPTSLLGDYFSLIEFSDHAQHFAAMAEKDPEPIEVLIRQFGKDTQINRVLGKTQRILSKPKLLEPVRNLLHWLHRLSAWRLAEFWTTLKLSQSLRDSMSCFAAFGRNWPSIFAKLVQEYRRPLPSRASHEENNRIAARARFRQQAALRNPTTFARTGD
jgi:hypothetical protein